MHHHWILQTMLNLRAPQCQHQSTYMSKQPMFLLAPSEGVQGGSTLLDGQCFPHVKQSSSRRSGHKEVDVRVAKLSKPRDHASAFGRDCPHSDKKDARTSSNHVRTLPFLQLVWEHMLRSYDFISQLQYQTLLHMDALYE